MPTESCSAKANDQLTEITRHNYRTARSFNDLDRQRAFIRYPDSEVQFKHVNKMIDRYEAFDERYQAVRALPIIRRGLAWQVRGYLRQIAIYCSPNINTHADTGEVKSGHIYSVIGQDPS